jgi:hypothetical protein
MQTNSNKTRILAGYSQLTPSQRALVSLVVDALADKTPHPLDDLSLSLVKMAQEMCNRGQEPVIALANAAYLLAEPVTAQQFRAALNELDRRFSGIEIKPWGAQS